MPSELPGSNAVINRDLTTYFVHGTSVIRRPWFDYIVIMHPDDMKVQGIRQYDYVLLKNRIGSSKTRELQVEALVISKDNKFSAMKNLKPGNIGVDQTYRESLFVRVHESIELCRTKRKYGLKDRFLNYLNFQKVVLRVQFNPTHMEQHTIVACIPEEIVDGLGIKYGDRITLESHNGIIEASCVRFDPNMKLFHEKIKNSPFDQETRKRNKEQLLPCGYECCREYDHSPRSTDNDDVDEAKKAETGTQVRLGVLTTRQSSKGEDGRIPIEFSHYAFPEHYGTTSGDGSVHDIIHPIFVDAMATTQLGVEPFDLVKVRRSARWEFMKKITSFGPIEVMGLSVLLPVLFIAADKTPVIVAVILLGICATLSTIFSPKFKV